MLQWPLVVRQKVLVFPYKAARGSFPSKASAVQVGLKSGMTTTLPPQSDAHDQSLNGNKGQACSFTGFLFPSPSVAQVQPTGLICAPWTTASHLCIGINKDSV